MEMVDRMFLVNRLMQTLVKGYGGRVHGHLSHKGGVAIAIEFADLTHATCCADTMTRNEYTPELEALLPRPAVSADLAEGAIVASIHEPVTLWFLMNERFMAHVERQAVGSE